MDCSINTDRVKQFLSALNDNIYSSLESLDPQTSLQTDHWQRAGQRRGKALH
ncbi:MAG: hypothetical protein QGG54_05680 [Gammaproteobacteria bacterium]|nr:hypothetical protein [Gammaproteobacteria bacterium]